MSPEYQSDAAKASLDSNSQLRSKHCELESGEAGVLSNTPPSITKCSGGEDWLELGLYLHHWDFTRLKRRLDQAREAAESNSVGGDELVIAGRKFLMLPTAASAGTKEKQVVYRWRLRSEDGWWLLLMNRGDCHETLPTGIARATSVPLMRLGPLAFMRQLHESLNDLNIRLVRAKVSRVDPCVDLAKVRIDGLYHAFMAGHFVSRARYSTDRIVDEEYAGYRIARQPTGFEMGKGDVRMRAYDKYRKSVGDSEILLLMQTRRWGGIVGCATRVEFQLRREKLKTLGVDTLDDWWAKRGAITHYLTTDWCRILTGQFDPHHPDRTETHADWIATGDAFAEWAGKEVADLSPLPKLPIEANDLLRQVLGTLVSYHARVGTSIRNNSEFFQASGRKLFEQVEERNLAEEVQRRAIELGIWRP